MALQFTIDPATGVYKPPVTVFNGGKQKRKAKKTRKSKKNKKSKKTLRRRG